MKLLLALLLIPAIATAQQKVFNNDAPPMLEMFQREQAIKHEQLLQILQNSYQMQQQQQLIREAGRTGAPIIIQLPAPAPAPANTNLLLQQMLLQQQSNRR